MNIENRNDSEYPLIWSIKYVGKEELKKQYPDHLPNDDGIAITTISKSTDSKDPNIWKGFKFPMGAFMVWSQDGRLAWGKCDPLTKEVIEWNEKKREEDGKEMEKSC